MFNIKFKNIIKFDISWIPKENNTLAERKELQIHLSVHTWLGEGFKLVHVSVISNRENCETF